MSSKIVEIVVCIEYYTKKKKNHKIKNITYIDHNTQKVGLKSLWKT